MAAGQLQKPGTKYGPCKSDCTHRDCAETRTMAEALCRICSYRIGYETLFFQEGSVRALVHEACVAAEIEREQATA
jgi:hypothetical protein